MSEIKSFSGHTKTYCIFGYPVEHSMSPTMWNPALQELGLDYVYVAFEVHPDNLEKAVEAVKALDIKGLNVTIPHKENIIQYLDEVEEVAFKIGAINTIKNENGYLKAKNTDAGGAKKSLIDAGCKISGKNVVIIGSGGVTRAIAFILSEEAERIVLTDIIEDKAIALASEIKEKTYANILGKMSINKVLKEEIAKADILINATPIGMYPKPDASPVPMDYLHSDLFVFDVIYNPLETLLMKEAAEIGCKTLGGLDMLINQGVLAFEWLTGKTPNKDLMKKKIIEFLGIK